MEQPSTPTSQDSATVYRAAPPRSAPRVLAALRLLRRLHQVPGPRFTGLGCGLVATTAMVVVGALDELMLDGSSFAYGVMFVLLSAACGLWVRSADLITAPISVPIAFMAGLVPISGGESGVGGQVVAAFTQLALQAGWLYSGTLTAALVVVVRKLLLLGNRAARRAERIRSGPQTPSGPAAERA
ncbi:DUF6542 domain-containing protein [Streptomyces sp. KR80]|uniref:DUF6542 domain-containing protein n=1 Tax=Streptomyces sp. KR80 TaxID=3457426 RepID=UPI003FD3C8E1